MKTSPITTLIQKEMVAELRQQHTFWGVLLYVASTVFVIRMMSGEPGLKMWNALFWITQLFIAVNSIAKSFLQEHPNRFRYYFTLVKPTHFLIAKMIYSTLLMMLVTAMALLLFSVLLPTSIYQLGQFVGVCALGSFSLSITFTFLSAIASRAHNNASLIAILGFPLMLPLLMILNNLALNALAPVYQPGWWSWMLVLAAFDILIIILGIILFPFLWQE